jgi:hypothetical protein
MSRDVAVGTDSKLYFHQYVDLSFSHTIEFLELIRTITRFFSTTDSLTMLYFALVRFKLECASIAWISHDYRLHYISEHIKNCSPLPQHFLFPSMYYLYENLLEKLNLQTRDTRRRHVDA